MAEHGIQNVVPVALPSENIAVQNATHAQPKEIINVDEQKNVELLKEKTETSESIVKDQTEKSAEDEEEEKFFDYSDEMCGITTAEDLFEKYVLSDSENTDSAAEFSRKFELINKEIEDKADSISEEINKKANRLPIDAEEAELEFAHYLENIATDLYNRHFNFSDATAKKVIDAITMAVLGGVSGFAIFTPSGRRLAKNYANKIATKLTDLFINKKPRFVETEEIEKFEEEVKSLYSSDKSIDIIERGFIPIRKMIKNYPVNEDQFNRFRSKLLDVLDEAAKADLGFPKKYKSMIDPGISHDE